MTGMPSLFANLPNISMFPTPEAARLGAERAKYGKEPFTITSYNVKVFDMSKEEDRTGYCQLMEKLMPLCQDAKCVVNKNELQVLNNSWHRYVEWFEYKLNETSLTSKEEPEKPEDPSDSTDSTDNQNDFDGIW